MKNIIEVDEANFEQEITGASLPVVVDFYASWCGPCQMMAPVLDGLAVEFEGKIKFAKVDVDNDQALAMRYAITGVPTLIIFKGGQVVDTIVGMLPPLTLRTRLQAVGENTATPARENT